MRTLILNIGNTHTQAAEWRRGTLSNVTTMATEEIEADLMRLGFSAAADWRCLAACVVPDAGRAVSEMAPPGGAVFLSAECISRLDFSQVDVSTLGADRMANAVAAVDLVGAPCIVLDCGTALTVEVIDGQSRFCGGAILPGRKLLRQSLNDHTAQLPCVPISGSMPVVIGTDTVSAIRSGVDVGVLGAVEIVLSRTRRQMGSLECRIIVTGGDADYFCDYLAVENLAHAPEWFTLSGVATVASDLWGAE